MNRLILLATFLPFTAIAADSPKAVLAETEFDFGLVKRGDKIVHRFAIRNEGSAPLTLERAELSLPGMNVRYRKTIPPQEEGTVTVEWNTAPVNGKQDTEVLLYCDDPAARELRIRLQAAVQPPIEFDPYAAVFLSVFQGQTASRTLRLLIHQERPLHILKLEPSVDYVNSSLRTIRDGREYELSVTAGDKAPLGRRQEKLLLQTDDPSSPQLHVLVNLFVKTDVYANPESIDFGEVNLEQLRKQPSLEPLLTTTFLVKKREGSFAVKSVRSDLPAITIRRDPDGDSGVFRIDVSLKPSELRPGDLRGTILVETNDPVFPEIRVPLTAKIR